ncbi:MAG: Nramp family divalent metal transporter [Chloroflexota bacterium]|nr:Nramp family divalent metal transporter [Chloroflexota bacterium]
MAEGVRRSRADVAASDTATVRSASEVLEGTSRKRGLARLLPFLGPAFIASVAYIDPGNFATNIQGGAQFGYLLVWVILASNVMAILIQALSAKLGIATGRNLPETIRDHFPPFVVWMLWILAEVVAMATDLAEFLGAALGFNLLFGMNLLTAGIITGITTFLILALQRYGFRPLEAVIAAFVAVIAVCYVIEIFLVGPDWGAIGGSIVRPRFVNTESVLLATGILGATVMPHVIYLHSSLTQHRIVPRNAAQAKRIFRFELVDVVIALGLAGLVNGAMLVMAAGTFHGSGRTNVGSIEEAYQTLTPLLGGAASTVFAISLLASGLSSSTVGTMAGQVIMQGFVARSIPIWIRRLVTMLPALIVIGLGLDPTRTLVISQVVLSFGIPFALVPLVIFTSRRSVMGEALVNRGLTTVVASLVATLIVGLNVFLLFETFRGIIR